MKPRPVLSLADGLTRILDALGAQACATAVGKSTGLMYRWANPDDDTKPSFEQAVILDQLWLKSGRPGSESHPPPLLAAYQARLPRSEAMPAGAEKPVDYRDRVMAISAECGDLSRALSAALADNNVSPNDEMRLAKELRELRGQVDAMERQLAARKGRS